MNDDPYPNAKLLSIGSTHLRYMSMLPGLAEAPTSWPKTMIARYSVNVVHAGPQYLQRGEPTLMYWSKEKSSFPRSGVMFPLAGSMELSIFPACMTYPGWTLSTAPLTTLSTQVQFP